MARVTYGSGITEYKGSIGGITYQRNASGPVAKLRSIWTVNPSPSQAVYQRNLAYLVSYWPTLSQANKDAWDALAAAHDHTTPWGETKTLSGYQWFLTVNLFNLAHNGAFLTSPYSWYVPSPADQFTIETSASYFRAAWSPPYDAPGSLFAYVSLPLRQSSIKLRRSLFFLKFYISAPSLSNWDLTSAIESLFNVTWSTFYASSNCHIILRIRQGDRYSGYLAPFTSAIVKIG
jgi:hypothetical protein